MSVDLEEQIMKTTLQTANTELFCICCLETGRRLVNLQNCNHSEFLDNFYMPKLDPSCQVVCRQCHDILKKIKLFKQQVENSIKILNNQTSNIKTINQRAYNLNLTTDMFKIDISPTNPNKTEKCTQNIEKKERNIQIALNIIKRNNESVSFVASSLKSLTGYNLLDLTSSLLNAESLKVPITSLDTESVHTAKDATNIDDDDINVVPTKKIKLEVIDNNENLNQFEPSHSQINPGTPHEQDSKTNDTQPISGALQLKSNGTQSETNDSQTVINKFPQKSNDINKLNPIKQEPGENEPKSNELNTIKQETSGKEAEIIVRQFISNEYETKSNELNTIKRETNKNLLEFIESQLKLNEKQSNEKNQLNAINQEEFVKSLVKSSDDKPQSNEIYESKLNENQPEVNYLQQVSDEFNIMKQELNETQPELNESNSESLVDQLNLNKRQPVLNETLPESIETQQTSNESQLGLNENQLKLYLNQPDIGEIKQEWNELDRTDAIKKGFIGMRLKANKIIELIPHKRRLNCVQPESNQIQPESNEIQPESNKILPEFNKIQPESDQNQADLSQIQTDSTTGIKKPKRQILNRFYKKINCIKLTNDELLEERSALRMESEYLRSNHKCVYCIIAFNYSENLKDHIKRKHTEKPGSTKCVICSQMVTEEYKNHLTRHYKRYECLECKKRFNLLNDAEAHVLKHNMEKRRQRIKRNIYK